MTNMEKIALLSCAERLERLASLENACFCFDKDKDAEIKQTIKCWLQWFDCVADNIRTIVNLDEEKDRYWKKHQLEEIVRYNH